MHAKKFLFWSFLILALTNDTTINASRERGMTLEEEAALYKIVSNLAHAHAPGIQLPVVIIRNMLYNLCLEKSQARTLGLTADCLVPYLIDELILTKNGCFFNAQAQAYFHMYLLTRMLGVYGGSFFASLVKKYVLSVNQNDAESKVLSGNENH